MINRIWMPVLLIPLACLAGASVGYLVPSDWRSGLISYSAAGICLLFFFICGGLLYRSIRVEKPWNKWRQNLPLILLSFFVVLLYECTDHRANKVIQDELILQASALQMMQQNEYRTPQFSHNLENNFSVMVAIPDKRPPLFPFILSLVHRILGYSQSNGYLLNAALGFIALFFAGKCGQSIIPPMGGILAILGMGSLPLLSQNVTSQHMEILYLALIAILMHTCIRIVRRKDPNDLALAYLLATGITLTRYEGVLFFAVPYSIHLYLAWKNQPIQRLSLVYLASPISLAFIFVLIGFVFENPGFWQLDTLQNSQPFGLVYLSKNTGALFDFMLTTGRDLPSSLPLSVLCIASVPVGLTLLTKDWKNLLRSSENSDPLPVVLTAFLITMLMFLGLIFSYHWGYVNSHLTSRFLLFPYLVLGILSLYCLKREAVLMLTTASLLLLLAGGQSWFIDDERLGVSYWLVLAGFLILLGIRLRPLLASRFPMALVLFWVTFLIMETMPAISLRKYEADYYPISRTRLFLEWVDAHAGENAIYISESPYYGILARESAMSLQSFGLQPDYIVHLMRTGHFSNIFILQETDVDEQGKATARKGWWVPERIATTPVFEKRIRKTTGVRILRVTGISEAPEVSSQEQ